MSPQRLALRTVLLGQPRARVAILLVAASLCMLDLFAGRVAVERHRLEYQAVVGERAGHLAITRDGGFNAAEAARARSIAQGVHGVALVMAQVDVAGVASTGQRAALFTGTGIAQPPAPLPDVVAGQPGRLRPGQPNGIALSSGQAESLGLRNGSAVTLTGVAPDTRPVPLNAQVVDIFSTAGFSASARSLLMPLEMAQTLLDTGRTQRLAVYLANPKEVDTVRGELAAALGRASLAAQVRTWRELSTGYAKAEWAMGLQFACLAAVAFVVAAAAIGATAAMNTFERRRELAMLCALGMRRSGVFGMIVAEALWITLIGAVLSLGASGLIAWMVNRVAMSFTTGPGMTAPQLMVDLDFSHVLAAFGAALGVAVLAAFIPAFKAARSDVASGLSGGAQAGW